MKKYDAVIIGAGAAGLFAAGLIAEKGKTVALIEKNSRVGKKLLITGKGRCNVTNNCTADDFIKFVNTNARFMYSAINSFTPDDTMSFFENHGVALKTERGNRVFPVSDKSSDIVNALDNFTKNQNTDRYNGKCKALVFNENGLAGVKLENSEIIYGDNVLIATGGKSYPQTGSDGDGYVLAMQAGHSIVEPKPSLVPVIAKEDYCRDMMGLSLKNVTLSVLGKKKKPIYEELGEMLFTHFGVSGPLVLSASAHLKGDINDYKMYIDLKPGLSEEQLDRRILRDFDQNINKDFVNSLGDLLPRKMIPTVIKLSEIPFECKVNQITKEQRQKLCGIIKHLPVTPTALRSIDEAIVTAGGVKVKEIDPKTMESKIIPGLYFAGEVIDVDAYTGGFNLQIAFSTAFSAACDIINKAEE